MVIRNFDKESNLHQKQEYIYIDGENITKEHVNSLSKDNTNSGHNDTLDNQQDLNNSEMMETIEMKKSDTIGELKDDHLYVLDGVGDNFHDRLLKKSQMTKKG